MICQRTRVCLHCGKPISPERLRYRAIFCSVACRKQSDNRRTKQDKQRHQGLLVERRAREALLRALAGGLRSEDTAVEYTVYGRPCKSMPGSWAKMAVLAKRIVAGLPLWCPGDATGEDK